ncbi:hypothetical protein GDO81_014834 [Engystomops pustulosus]|uniref:Uncharacterized protein n=1 Tax=Engystomops pustulosus TaxID=76066 RepID=A0AAV7AJM2_ENGPU|nr:hypothetical protein GDO81_014834 [Engystomops pustulosus]
MGFAAQPLRLPYSKRLSPYLFSGSLLAALNRVGYFSWTLFPPHLPLKYAFATPKQTYLAEALGCPSCLWVLTPAPCSMYGILRSFAQRVPIIS